MTAKQRAEQVLSRVSHDARRLYPELHCATQSARGDVLFVVAIVALVRLAIGYRTVR